MSTLLRATFFVLFCSGAKNLDSENKPEDFFAKTMKKLPKTKMALTQKADNLLKMITKL